MKNMEKDPFDKSRFETSSDEDDAEGSTYKKKKKTNLRPPLFESKESKKSAETEGEKSVGDSLWQRLLGQTEGESSKQTAEKQKETADEKVAELTEEEAANLPLEELSPEEQAAVVQEYLAARQAELIEEQARAVEGDDEQLAAERVADLALLDATRQLLREQPEEPYEHPLQEAYERVAGYFGVSPAEAAAVDASTRIEDPVTETVNVPRETTQAWNVREAAPTTEATVPVMSAHQTETVVAPTVVRTEKQENHTGTALLVGAAVGYLVGRRRGRIKTEKQAAKVEKKLTNQIHNLERTVAEKEQRIRTIAREVYVKSKNARGVASETLHNRRAPAAETAASAASGFARPEREPQRDVMPSSELLGAVTLKAVETLPQRNAAETNQAKNTPEQGAGKELEPQKPVEKSAESMSREELMEKAANVSVGATNLRRVYETHLVTEEGLRRLIIAHERGGNVQQLLKQELVEKESSFERDPRMRNRSAVGALAAGAVVALPTRSATADKSSQSSSDDAAGTKHDSSLPSKPQNNSSQVAGVITAATLVVIIAVLLYILFTSR